ncbi:hypothetical protein [Pseudomonas lini]|uniref:Uncharacterized protein n=1 Tax=Pseudomonas lini TaxID=163011 RepID=A0A0J6HG65_9PSED|nr:hypothetical protein [Pseudomonas lini]KAB0503571.1 hypothetical protein F7R14_17645 [Pseudomonas lini]KMM93244.1 hypothetical protein TU81_10535 [Pseudomonas lini]NSX08383.1 hypothetical protein [Pseudomonas lini]SDT50983.1 hypothetical protein SAMN04490191_4858 [Pseudomonas lini]
MKTKYQIALENGELPELFKGSGQYFWRDPDWGVHLYINNWQGLCGFLQSKSDPNKTLELSFAEYLHSLKNEYNDAESLISNISSYYSMRKDYEFMSNSNYDLIEQSNNGEKTIIGRLFRLLRNEYATQSIGKPVITLDVLLSRIRNNGCSIDLEKL